MRGVAGLIMVTSFGAGALLLRAIRHKRRTGSWGIALSAPGARMRERAVGGLFVLAVLSAVTAPVLELVGVMKPIVRTPALFGAGIALYAIGATVTIWAQEAMGASWRMGVDPDDRTELVTNGPFTAVRNPIYTGMLAAAAGIASVVPNWVAVAGFIVLVVALELQTRLVEEAHLLRTHGAPYVSYATRTGRFVPGIGRGLPRLD